MVQKNEEGYKDQFQSCKYWLKQGKPNRMFYLFYIYRQIDRLNINIFMFTFALHIFFFHFPLLYNSFAYGAFYDLMSGFWLVIKIIL